MCEGSVGLWVVVWIARTGQKGFRQSKNVSLVVEESSKDLCRIFLENFLRFQGSCRCLQAFMGGHKDCKKSLGVV